MTTLYDDDFYGWTQEQMRLLRLGHVHQLDSEHLLEEIESMGNTEKRELESRFEVLFLHLLKWQYQPARRGQSWALTIAEQRYRIDKRLKASPSLKSKLDEILVEAYDVSRFRAARETGLDLSVFPLSCPWTFEQIMEGYFG